VAIEAIKKYLDKRDRGIPLSEIKRRIAEYVDQRDTVEWRRDCYINFRDQYYIREGKQIERVRLCGTAPDATKSL
jgi:hypothetical protein